MILGFTGARDGLTTAQKATAQSLLLGLDFREFASATLARVEKAMEETRR